MLIDIGITLWGKSQLLEGQKKCDQLF